MAKTIDEILNDLEEWVDESPAERSFMAIIGDEKRNIKTRTKGREVEVITCLASAIYSIPELGVDLTRAMNIVKEYRKEKQQEENN